MRGYWDTDRTLLVLDLAVSPSELDDLWRGIAHRWPAYLGYATSFISVARVRGYATSEEATAPP